MNTFIHSYKLEDMLEKFPVKLIKTIYRAKFKEYWLEPQKNCISGRGFELAVWRPGVSNLTAHITMDQQMNIQEFCEELINMPYFYYHTMTDKHYYRFFMSAPNEEILLDCFSDIEKLALIQ